MHIKLIAREELTRHPILNCICKYFDYESFEGVNIKTSGFRTLKVRNGETKQVYIITDPIIFFLFYLVNFFKSKELNIYFFSLEMFEYQVVSDSVRSKLRNFIFKIAHKFALKRSSRVIFPSKVRAEFYKKRYEICQDIFILPNYISIHKYKELKAIMEYSKLEVINIIKKKYKEMELTLSNIKKPVCIYAGNLSDGPRGINVIIDAFERQNNIILFVVGKDRDHIFKDRKLKNVVYLGEVEPSDIGYFYALAEFGILFYSNDIINTAYCAPIKVHEYFSCGLCVLGNENRGLNEYVDKNFRFKDSDSLLLLLKSLNARVSIENVMVEKFYEEGLGRLFVD